MKGFGLAYLLQSFCGVIADKKYQLADWRQRPLPQEMVPQEKLRLKKEKEKLVVLFDKTKGQLSNEEFVQRAPQALVDKLQLQLKATEKELKEIEEKIIKSNLDKDKSSKINDIN